MPGMKTRKGTARCWRGSFFYTDGLVAAHNPNGEMFGSTRLRALIPSHGEGRLEDSFFSGRTQPFRRGLGAEDDITILSPTPSRPPSPNLLHVPPDG